MYTRVTLFQFDSARMDEVTAKLRDIEPAIQAIGDLVTAYICWREDGQAVSFAVYPSESHAEKVLPQIQAIWSDVADMLVGTPQTDVFTEGQSFVGQAT